MQLRSGTRIEGLPPTLTFEAASMTSKKRPCEADENDGDENSQPYKRRSGPREPLVENKETEFEVSKSSTDPCWRCRILKKPCDDDGNTCKECLSVASLTDKPHVRCRLQDLHKGLDEVYPPLPGLGTHEWYCPAINSIFLRIKLRHNDPTKEIHDVDVLSLSPGGLVAYLKQFHDINSRWGQEFEVHTEEVITECAEIQKDIVLKNRRIGKPLTEENLLIAMSLRALGLTHRISELTMHLSPESNDEFLKSGRFKKPVVISDSQDPLLPVVEVCRVRPKNVLRDDRNDRKLTILIQQIVKVTYRLIIRGRPSDWPAIVCVLCLLNLTQETIEGLEYIVGFENVGELGSVWKMLCDLFDFSTKGHHPLVDSTDASYYESLVGSKNMALEHFLTLNSYWMELDIPVRGPRDTLPSRMDRFVNGYLGIWDDDG